MQALTRWLLNNGAWLGHTQVKEIAPGHRGVFANARLNPNDRALLIPCSCILNLEKASTTQAAKNFRDNGYWPRDPQTLLALLVLEERAKGDESFYAPYIATLPKTFDSVPLFYAQKQKNKLLRGCLVDTMVACKYKRLQLDHKEVTEKGKVECKWEDFLWARTVVVTRAFARAEGGGDALVPLADMLNHSPAPNIHWAHEEVSGDFVMRCTRPCAKGSQLTDSYGPKCNSRYFVNYGFALLHNEANNQACVFVNVEEAQRDAVKKCILGTCANYDDGYSYFSEGVHNGWVDAGKRIRFQVQAPGRFPPKLENSKRLTPQICFEILLRALRVVVATPEELVRIHATSLLQDIPVLGERNELAAWNLMLTCLRARLAEIPEPGQEPAEKHSQAWNVFVVRQSERQVLDELVAWASQRLVAVPKETKRASTMQNGKV